MINNIQNKLLQNFADPNFLPSVNELKEAFPIEDSFVTNSKELPYLSLEFTKFQYEHNYYQVYTKEFIESLSKYLANQIKAYYKEYNTPITLLEVGSGDGRLSLFLQQELSNILDQKLYLIVSTDNKDWEKRGMTNKESNHVVNMDYKDAIKKYAAGPTIILSCWMNVDVDWTGDFRSETTIKEYIMIGDVFRTAYYGQGYYLPINSDFICKRLSQEDNGHGKKIVNGLVGRFDGSPHNPTSKTEVYAFIRQ